MVMNQKKRRDQQHPRSSHGASLQRFMPVGMPYGSRALICALSAPISLMS